MRDVYFHRFVSLHPKIDISIKGVNEKNSFRNSILLWKNLGKLRKMLRRVTRCDLFSLDYFLFAWEEYMQLLKTFGGKGQSISE